MPARVSREEKLERLIAKTKARVDNAPEAAARSLRHSPDSLLSTLVKEAGYDRISPKLLEELEDGLEVVGVSTHPKLTDPGNTVKTRIHFFDSSRPIPGFQQPRQLFNDEKELSRFLQLNWDQLAYVTEHGLRLRGSEFTLAHNCKIDLLAIGKKSDILVGFELKVGEGDDRLIAQVQKYLPALKAYADKEDRAGVRLVVITGQPDEELAVRIQELAERYEVETEWLLYTVSIDLPEAK